MSDFPCTMCGACCKRIDKAVKQFDEYEKCEELRFPHKWDETGRCEMLGENNECKVYNDRPLICDIEKLVPYFYMDKINFYRINIRACNKMMDEDGLPENLRINEHFAYNSGE